MKRRKFIAITLPLTLAGISKAAGTKQPDLVFGVIADPQYADIDPRGSRYYRNSLGKLASAVEDLNGKKLSFVATLGDIIEKDIKSFDDIMPIYSKLNHPHYMILGNHDFSVPDEDKDKVEPAMGLKNPYYSKEINHWRLIFLDGTDISMFHRPADHPVSIEARMIFERLREAKKAEGRPYNGAVGKEQMNWLKAELDAARVANQKVIIFNHYPVVPAGNYHNLWNAEQLLDLLGKYDNVAAYMNGHNHSGNYGTREGIHCVNFKGMVETEDKTAYAVVRCYPDRLEIEGYGMEPERDLKKL